MVFVGQSKYGFRDGAGFAVLVLQAPYGYQQLEDVYNIPSTVLSLQITDAVSLFQKCHSNSSEALSLNREEGKGRICLL